MHIGLNRVITDWRQMPKLPSLTIRILVIQLKKRGFGSLSLGPLLMSINHLVPLSCGSFLSTGLFFFVHCAYCHCTICANVHDGLQSPAVDCGTDILDQTQDNVYRLVSSSILFVVFYLVCMALYSFSDEFYNLISAAFCFFVLYYG